MKKTMVCQYCGKEFEYEYVPHGHRRFCDTCAKRGGGVIKACTRGTRKASTSIESILSFAPKYGLAPYEYGKIMVKLAWGDGV